MSRRAPSLRLLSLSVLLLAACGGGIDRDDGRDRLKNRDLGNFQSADAGSTATPDDAGIDCSSNPNGCAQFQVRDPQCNCVPQCAMGYVWNDQTRTCDLPGQPDMGVSPPDMGVPPRDMGVSTPDMGTPDMGGGAGGCSVDRDCPGANGTCVFVPQMGQIESCGGRMGCQCIASCNPFVEVPSSGCASGEACFWLGAGAPVEGACVNDASPNAGLQNATCSVQFDSSGNRTGSMGCNENQNFYCWGATPDAPTGRCGRFCSPLTPGTLCASFGNYSCVDLSSNGSIGLCLNQLSNTDIGNACMDASMCQSECVPGLGCSARCDGLDWCPNGSLCLNAGSNICFRECTSDSFCAGLNPETICETFGTSPNTFSICFPRCRSNMDCAMGQTCNTNTGRCQ